MISIEDIEKLATLSRLKLTEAEKIKFQKGIDSILNYVDKVRNIKIDKSSDTLPNLRNIFRADEKPIEKGKFTEAIVGEFPKKEGNYLKVKKIL